MLADVQRERVDTIVCGGDIASGPFPTEVFDRLTTLPNVLFVRGNADRLVVEGVREHGFEWSAERDRFGKERVGTMAAWPLTVELEIEGLGRTLFCHAIPTADEPIFTRITPDEAVAELIGDVEAELVVCGHTHVQFDRRLANGLRVVNAGSVGMPYEGRRGAFWALLGPTVELRRTEYDVEAAAASMRAAGPTNEQQASLLLDAPDPDEVSGYFESQRIAQHGA